MKWKLWNMGNNNYDLWIFGDSFVSSDDGNDFWVDIIKHKFNGTNYYISQCDARDIQTIMDTYYKNLFNIKNDSLVIIFLPSMARLRYPKNKKYYTEHKESSFRVSVADYTDICDTELFSHWPYKNYPNGTAIDELDFPFNIFDYNILKNNDIINYLYYTEDEHKKIKKSINDNISPIDFAKLIVANNSTKQNWNDIFISLKKTFNYEILFCSWTDEYETDIVYGKHQLTNEIGYWHTQHDEFIESGGKTGMEWDEHFSKKMHIGFSEWIMNKYTNYFNL